MFDNSIVVIHKYSPALYNKVLKNSYCIKTGCFCYIPQYLYFFIIAENHQPELASFSFHITYGTSMSRKLYTDTHFSVLVICVFSQPIYRQ